MYLFINHQFADHTPLSLGLRRTSADVMILDAKSSYLYLPTMAKILAGLTLSYSQRGRMIDLAAPNFTHRPNVKAMGW